jgi:hypothetical protein
MLLLTGDEELIEGNFWGDVFWGVCNGVGKNHLGKILMEVRSELGGAQSTQQSSLETITFAEESSNKQIQEDVLKSDTTTIIANEKEVKVKVNKEDKAVNISDTKALLSDLLSRQDEIADEINRAEVVSEVDETLPVLDPKERIQYDLFESEITSEVTKYAYLAEQYDELIKDGSNRSIMMDNNLFPLSSMIEEYQNTMKYESKGEEVNQKEFVDNIKKCILK